MSLRDQPMTLQELADVTERTVRQLAEAVRAAASKVPPIWAVGPRMAMRSDGTSYALSAPADPGEGVGTGAGDREAENGSQGAMDAAIEAARMALSVAVYTDDAVDVGIEYGMAVMSVDFSALAQAAVRAAEPLLRQAVAEEIARAIERNAGLWEDYGQHPDGVAGARRAASIAREVGRGE